MCLALPAQVLSSDGISARVRIGRTERTVINPISARAGDIVLVQQDTLVEKIERKTADEMLSALLPTRRKKRAAAR
ncbi:MAG: HypC/HybG/HupF family hydrogenase formation chaperone [Candidatus Diapherotrites archaeon]|nr:HypC/HybG/HupF family hydrogenase formation chaperone [Candidatus Diapherotrites archaeon]